MFYNNLNIYKIHTFSLSLFDNNYQLLFCSFYRFYQKVNTELSLQTYGPVVLF